MVCIQARVPRNWNWKKKSGIEASPFTSAELFVLLTFTFLYIILQRDFFCLLMPHLPNLEASDLKATAH